MESQQAVKRQRLVGEKPVLPIYATQFTKEEIESEPKRPKRKVAVMMGYSGSGYKGMQLCVQKVSLIDSNIMANYCRNYNERTIEGDLFKAFVGAGAISKANADDPKKSGLIRCARTDKGVHAAGNIVSLKLIVEDPEVVSKINEKLSSQIRVFGIERTNGSFSAYQFCDSRIYEYLVPTHCFLPPHPSSYLGRRLDELAKKADDEQGYKERQEEVSSFWAETEKNQIQPILERIDPSIRSLVQRALYEISVKEAEEEFAKTTRSEIKVGGVTTLEVESLSSIDHNHASTETAGGNEPTEPQTRVAESDALAQQKSGDKSPKATVTEIDEQGTLVNSEEQTLISQKTTDTSNAGAKISDIAEQTDEESAGLRLKQLSTLEFAIRELRSAYISAKKAYRIHPQRLERVRSTLSRYVGTQNFHNYTIDKGFRDASAKRVIKSFIVALDPIIIGDTEWLSLKVHGQSFMMHQIRKMVSMAALVIRCGCHEGRVQDSYMADNLSIPKAPGLGLLLERPVFDTYNERLVGQYEREPIEFKKYEKEMEDFKQREIYERIFREEENNNTYASRSLNQIIETNQLL